MVVLRDASFLDLLFLFVCFMFVFVMLSSLYHEALWVSYWERAGILAHFCVLFSYVLMFVSQLILLITELPLYLNSFKIQRLFFAFVVFYFHLMAK